MPRLHCIVQGRVQGVGFRYFAQRAAVSRQLTGWVRNLRDGSVETEVEGPEEALQAYLLELTEGPAFGRVTDVEQTWEEADGQYDDFRIRHSL